MSSKTLIHKILAGLLLVAFLAGCSSPNPTALAPTIDPKPTFDAIQTQAASTVVANLTLNAPTATQIPTATNTPEPTQTSAPTETPLPLPTNTPAVVHPTFTLAPLFTNTPAATATSTSSSYRCSIQEQSPSNNTELKPNESFDGRWVVKNTGSKTWNAADYDIRYVSGKEMQDKDVYDLQNDVKAGESYTVITDMEAPDSEGTYTTTWAIQGGQTVCTMSLTIKVVK